MVSEEEIILAFVFNRAGKIKLDFSEAYLMLSMQLNWFSPDDAKKFLNNSIKNKTLNKKGDEISPNFDIDEITIPVGFTPSKRMFLKEEKKVSIIEENILEQIFVKIIEKTNLEKKQINEKIKKISEELNLTIEVAVLLVCKEYEINCQEFAKEIENKIYKK